MLWRVRLREILHRRRFVRGHEGGKWRTSQVSDFQNAISEGKDEVELGESLVVFALERREKLAGENNKKFRQLTSNKVSAGSSGA